MSRLIQDCNVTLLAYDHYLVAGTIYTGTPHPRLQKPYDEMTALPKIPKR
jgi:hypothetical protein